MCFVSPLWGGGEPGGGWIIYILDDHLGPFIFEGNSLYCNYVSLYLWSNKSSYSASGQPLKLLGMTNILL